MLLDDGQQVVRVKPANLSVIDGTEYIRAVLDGASKERVEEVAGDVVDDYLRHPKTVDSGWEGVDKKWLVALLMPTVPFMSGTEVMVILACAWWTGHLMLALLVIYAIAAGVILVWVRHGAASQTEPITSPENNPLSDAGNDPPRRTRWVFTRGFCVRVHVAVFGHLVTAATSHWPRIGAVAPSARSSC